MCLLPINKEFQRLTYYILINTRQTLATSVLCEKKFPIYFETKQIFTKQSATDTWQSFELKFNLKQIHIVKEIKI